MGSPRAGQSHPIPTNFVTMPAAYCDNRNSVNIFAGIERFATISCLAYSYLAFTEMQTTWEHQQTMPGIFCTCRTYCPLERFWFSVSQVFDSQCNAYMYLCAMNLCKALRSIGSADTHPSCCSIIGSGRLRVIFTLRPNDSLFVIYLTLNTIL